MATFADIPLPEVPALAGTGPFAGAWAGYWGGVIPHVLLAGDGGPCVYAVGAVPQWNIPAGWSYWNSTISGGRLVLSGTPITVEYWPEGLDTLAGRYRATAGGDTWGRFVRAAPDLLHSAAALPDPVWGEAIRIPHVVGTLAGFWHAPLTEPAPLAVLSHGSSDGVDPRMTITMEGETRWLREQGYAVLVPMRRGRGMSDGASGEAGCCDLDTRAPLDCTAGLLGRWRICTPPSASACGSPACGQVRFCWRGSHGEGSCPSPMPGCTRRRCWASSASWAVGQRIGATVPSTPGGWLRPERGRRRRNCGCTPTTTATTVRTTSARTMRRSRRLAGARRCTCCRTYPMTATGWQPTSTAGRVWQPIT